MFRTLRLFGTFVSISLRRSLAFRADLVLELVFAFVGAGSSLAALSMIYTRTDALSGWRPGEAIVLLGTFQIVSGIRATFVDPNLQWFGDQVRQGRLDAVLVQPAPSIALASLSICTPQALVQVVAGFGVVCVGIVQLGVPVTATAVACWLVLVAAATVVMWATRVLVSTVVFWALGLSLDIVYDSLWQFGRYPITVYARPLRLILTYVFPIALIATVPADVLVRGADVVTIAVPVAVATGSVLVAVAVWRAGLRRYSSATS